MWKLLVAFAAFAALAIFILMKSGGDIDLSGEKHDVGVPHEAAPASAPASDVALQPAAVPASAPASAASQ